MFNFRQEKDESIEDRRDRFRSILVNIRLASIYRLLVHDQWSISTRENVQCLFVCFHAWSLSFDFLPLLVNPWLIEDLRFFSSSFHQQLIMLLRLLVTSNVLLVLVLAQTPATNSSKGQTTVVAILPKQASLYDDYDLNDQKLSGNRVEGSGGAASLDEYADDEEEDQLSKITATLMPSSKPSPTTTIATPSPTTTTTTTTTTTAMMIMTTRRTSTSTTSLPSKWSKTTFNYDFPKRRNMTTPSSAPFNDLDANEFKEDQEEYADELEDDAYYNEPTVSNKVSVAPIVTSRYPMAPTRSSLPVNHTTPIWMLFSFLTRPPIAAGILAGKSTRSATESSLFFVGSSRFGHRYFHIDHSSHLYYSTLSQTRQIAFFLHHGLTLSQSLRLRQVASGILCLNTICDSISFLRLFIFLLFCSTFRLYALRITNIYSCLCVFVCQMDADISSLSPIAHQV